MELEAAKFNAYLREDGLTEALEYRIKNKDSSKQAKNSTSVVLKLLSRLVIKPITHTNRKPGYPLILFRMIIHIVLQKMMMILKSNFYSLANL